MPTDAAQPLHALVELFHPRLEELGEFHEVPVASLPHVYRLLLAHEHHMTVTVEAFHRSPVDVRVVRKSVTPSHYAREILLVSQRDEAVVQYGIMRVKFAYLSPEVRADIQREDTPLGRILIAHNVLRRIHLRSLWRVRPAGALMQLLQMDEPVETFGRTALIECDGEPAVELLEIVAPVG